MLGRYVKALRGVRRVAQRASLHACRPCARNRLLFEREEVTIGTGGQLRATLRAGDARAEHIRVVLRLSPGDSLRVGVIGGLAATATLLASPSDGAAAPGGGALELEWAASGGQEARLERPGVDLLLALPRPKVLRRMWCQLAALGVGAVYLTNAAKARNPQPALRVERCYFDSHLADGATVRSELLKGLEQAGDTTLPAVFLAKRLPPLLDLLGVDLPDSPTESPTDPAPPGSAAAAPRRAAAWPWREVQSSPEGAAEPPLEAQPPPWGSWLVGSEADLPQKPQIRLLAHPGLGAASGARPALLAAAGAASASAGGALGLGLGAAGGPAAAKPPRVLLAVGPEGGWTPFELRLLQEAGFCPLSLGPRTLTTDVATIALIAAVREAMGHW